MKHMLRGLLIAAALGTANGAAADASQGSLLVVTKQSHALAIVDGATLKVTGHAPIGEDPHEVIVGPDGRTAYVSHFGEGTLRTLSMIDLVHAKALADINVSPLQGPHGMALHGNTLWFTADKSKALGALDLATGRILSVLGTGQDRTHMIWVSPDGAKILASNAGSGTMSVFDAVMNHPVVVPGAPLPPASYTAPGWKHTLVPVGVGAEGFAVSPNRKEAWVGNADGKIPIIDLATDKVVATLGAGTLGANRLAFTPDGVLVVVTAHTGKDLVVIDARTRKIVKRIAIEERGASGIQMQPDGARVFIACPRDHYVAVVDLRTLTMVAKIDAGREPDGLAWWAH